ncbi:hypothetical protein BC833DRAFT_616466 [Globomyces pollinis-pini]|nr:hypothetical protein BC833DRAFT_616466 [Globomyces pollinis-pini]
MSPTSTPALSFKENEEVACYHGDLIYRAKVLAGEYWKNHESEKDGAYYFVHYPGWKSTHDEWVPESRLKHITEKVKLTTKKVKAKKVVAKKVVTVATPKRRTPARLVRPAAKVSKKVKASKAKAPSKTMKKAVTKVIAKPSGTSSRPRRGN